MFVFGYPRSEVLRTTLWVLTGPLLTGPDLKGL